MVEEGIRQGSFLRGKCTPRRCVHGPLPLDHSCHRGIVTGDRQAWRWAFLLGMAASAPLMASLLPGAFEAVPTSVPVRE